MFDVIVYHVSCADGIMSLWEACRTFTPKYICPVKAGYFPDFTKITDPLEELSILFCDVCPVSDFETLKRFKKVVVLDHHESALSAVDSLNAMGNCILDIDMTRSGAQITADFFRPEEIRFWMTDYCGDRDIWKFLLPHSKEVNLAIYKKGIVYQLQTHLLNTKSSGDFLSEEKLEDYITLGALLKEIQDKEIAVSAKCAYFTNIKMNGNSYIVWVSFVESLRSEVGEFLYKKPLPHGNYADFVFLPEFQIDKFNWKMSMRGRQNCEGLPNSPNLAEIAKSMGGGGHPGAAGFELSYEEFEKLLRPKKTFVKKQK